MVLDFRRQVDEADKVLADFGGWDGLGDANGCLELVKGGGGVLGLLVVVLMVLHIQ